VGEFINYEDCVSVFTTGGDFVTEFGSSRNEPGHFDRPSKSAVDKSGVVYVCDGTSNRVQLF